MSSVPSPACQLFGPIPPCRHCLQRPCAPYKRGLCRRCYRDPEIRALYPRLHNRTYNHIPMPILPLPDEPTLAWPGSRAKILVMIERMSTGRHPHHPHDARLDREDGRVRRPVVVDGLIVRWVIIGSAEALLA